MLSIIIEEIERQLFAMKVWKASGDNGLLVMV